MRDIFTILVVGCIGANAAVNHYDLLGRRGSEMNSPMVYKDIDYTKLKKNEPQKESTPPGVRALQKMGLADDVEAIEGAYRSGQNQNKLFYFKKNGDNCTGSNACLYNWNNYRYRSNEAFIDINISGTVFYGNSAPWSYLPSYVGDNPPNTTNAAQPSPYNSGDIIEYTWYDNVKDWVFYDHFSNVGSWFNNKASKVGIYMATDGLPSKLKTTRDVKYFRDNNTDTFKDGPAYENRESKAFNLIKDATELGSLDNSVVYVGRMDPTDPANKTPQIYIGVRNDRVGYSTYAYDSYARNLDNFIYQYRTLEFVPLGNDGKKNKRLNYQAHAANAVTVGAVNAYHDYVVADYSSSLFPYYETKKPEIFNFSDFVNLYDFTERRKDYHYGSRDYTYQPYYDGTEMATAYTAGMVADFLAVNPFYRWHPEVVKAFLITADGGRTISYAPNTATNKTLTYRYLVFDYANSANNWYNYDSRYWNGDINKLKTRTIQVGNGTQTQHEIWFVTSNLGLGTGETKAAISWLSSGDDIVNNGGVVPQDFDLYVYGSNNEKYNCMTKPGVNLNSSSVCEGHSFNFGSSDQNFITSSMSPYNSFEKVSFSTNYKYLIFKIILYGDNSSSANKGQIALGFNLSASR